MINCQKKIYELDSCSNEWIYYIIDSVFEQQDNLLNSLTDYHLKDREYWFMRKAYKQNHVRLRIKNTKDFSASQLEGYLLERNVSFKKVVYEPEIFLFGGVRGLKLAHNYFCLLSKLYVELISLKIPKNEINNINIMINDYLIKKILNDDFEVWDCWKRILALRTFEVEKHEVLIMKNKQIFEQLLEYSPFQFIPDTISQKKLIQTNTFIDEFVEASFSGELERGVRSILSCLVIFGWNIFAFKPGIQGGVAATFTKIYQP